jgi:hypothetical protein
MFATLSAAVGFYRRISRGDGRRDGGRRGLRGVNAQVTREEIDPLARRLNIRFSKPSGSATILTPAIQ